MEENMPQNMPKKGKPALWVILIVVVFIAVATFLYFGDFFSTNTNSNTNTVANTNTKANINVVANTNTTTNQNTNSDSTNTNSQTNTNSSSNTNSSTSNRKTYSNDQYNYSFEYPDNFSVQDYTDVNSLTYNSKIVSNIVVPVPSGNPYIQIDIVDDTLENVKTYLANQNSGKTVEWVDSTVDSISVQKAKVLFGDNYYINYYILEHDSNVYVISTHSSGDSADSVISGFKFLF
jgi:hypothetical protein